MFDQINELILKILYDFGPYPDSRSDDKGTEPEAVITFVEVSNTYAVIGLERSGDVFLVYNVFDYL